MNTLGVIATVAGTHGQCTSTGDGGLASAATFDQPTDIKFDPNDNTMTVLDSASGHIRTIDLSSGVVSLLTSQPGATGLWIDSSSNVYATIVNQVSIVGPGMPVPKAGNGASLQAGALDSITAATLANVGVNLPLLQATAATVAMEETR